MKLWAAPQELTCGEKIIRNYTLTYALSAERCIEINASNLDFVQANVSNAGEEQMGST